MVVVVVGVVVVVAAAAVVVMSFFCCWDYSEIHCIDEVIDIYIHYVHMYMHIYSYKCSSAFIGRLRDYTIQSESNLRCLI